MGEGLKITYDEAAETLAELEGLVTKQDPDFIKPTELVCRFAQVLIDQASSYMVHPFPLGTVKPTGRGGLKIEWVNKANDKMVMLDIPHTIKHHPYIHWQQGVQWTKNYFVSWKLLADKLDWLVD